MLRYVIFVLLSFAFLPTKIKAQYVVNGSAVSTSCNCYTITQNVNNQSGSVWNNNRIDLNQPFDFKFDVFLGCQDANGADGIVFILQPISTSVGSSGGGLGFQGIIPSVGVMLDTYQNTPNNDPTYDHISINANGDINHTGANSLAAPTQIIRNVDNAEDCTWHILRVTWNPTIRELMAYIDGDLRVQTTVDLVNNIFNGNSQVYWGFTAATGGLFNEQKFCTRLNAQITNTIAADTLCSPANTVTLNGVIDAFGPIASYYWNMGDGTTYTTQSINHTFSSPGIYPVKFCATGIDGCTSDTTVKNIIIANAPSVTATVTNACQGDVATFNGTINQAGLIGNVATYNWLVDNIPVPNANSATFSSSSFGVGVHTVSFQVTTNYGCTSNVYNTNFQVYAKPTNPTVTVATGCAGTTTAISSSTSSGVQYYWLVNGTSYPSIQSFTSSFAAGTYQIKHLVKNSDGCSSDTVTNNFTIYDKPIVQIIANDTCFGKPLRLSNATTQSSYTYQWSINGTIVASTPIYTTSNLPVGNHTVKLIITNGGICVDSAQKSITIGDKPLLQGLRTDVCFGQPNRFTVNNTNPLVSVATWYWSFADGSTSTLQNPSIIFPYDGGWLAKVVATSINGCVSDSAYIAHTAVKQFISAGSDRVVLKNQPFTLTGSADVGTYSWQPSTYLNNATILQPTATLPNDQTYILRVVTAQGCSLADTVSFKVFDESKIYVPTAFTPNGDGVNDALQPLYIGIAKLEQFTIYNRWGVKVFGTTQLNQGWNGQYKAIPMPIGTYVYTIKAIDLLGKVLVQKGTITIVK